MPSLGFARRSLRLCFLLVSVVVIAASSLLAQEFDGTSLTAPADLEKGWRVHAGDDPAFASPGFDDSQWPVFDARNDVRAIVTNQPSVVWYRLRVKVRPGQEGLALREVSLSSAFEIYANGRRILQNGSIAPFKPNTSDGLLLAPISSTDTTSGSVVIAARIHISRYEWSVPGPGLWYQNLTLGQYAALDNDNWLRVIGNNAITWLSKLAWLALGVVGIALFFAQRRQFEYLWMFLTAATGVLTLPLDLFRLFHNVSATWELARQPIQIGNIVFTLMMYFSLLRARVNWWIRGLVGVACAGMAFNLLGTANGSISMIASLAVAAPLFLIVCGLLPVLLLIHYRRGNREAGILLIAALVQSLWIYIGYGNAILSAIPATRDAALKFALDYVNYHVGPILIAWNSLTSLLYVLCLAIIIILRSTRVSRQQAMMESEMEAARQVQQIIVPEAIDTVAGFSVEAVYHPAQQVGGDFFQILPTTSGGMLVVVGDVAGKGLPAAMLVSVLVGVIRGVAAYTSDPAELLANLNERMTGRSGGAFSTALAAHISASGQVSIANAGHPSPYLDGAEVELQGALPLGVESGGRYEAIGFRLMPGSRLTFLSDGIVEAQNDKGELFGFDRSRELSRRSAAQIAEAARQFGQSDDITVVSVQRAAASESAEARLPNMTVAPATS
jgi:hypothetical protein